MSTTKPTDLPEWASAGTKVDPGSAKRAQGWLADERPPAENFNWWKNLTYEWLDWIDRQFDMTVVGELILKTDIMPGTDNTISVGTASNRFADVRTVALNANSVQTTSFSAADILASSSVRPTSDNTGSLGTAASSWGESHINDLNISGDIIMSDNAVSIGTIDDPASNLFAQRVVPINTNVNVVHTPYEIVRSKVPVAMCSFSQTSSTTLEFDTSRYRYNIASAEVVYFDPEQLSSGAGTATYRASAALRIRLDTPLANNNYTVEVASITDDAVSNEVELESALAFSKDLPSRTLKFNTCIVGATINIADPSPGANPMDPRNDLQSGDILIYPYYLNAAGGPFIGAHKEETESTAADGFGVVAPIFNNTDGGMDSSFLAVYTDLVISIQIFGIASPV